MPLRACLGVLIGSAVSHATTCSCRSSPFLPESFDYSKMPAFWLSPHLRSLWPPETSEPGDHRSERQRPQPLSPEPETGPEQAPLPLPLKTSRLARLHPNRSKSHRRGSLAQSQAGSQVGRRCVVRWHASSGALHISGPCLL